MKTTWLSSVWYWRVAVFECISDAFIAGAMVWCAAVANEDWGAISGTARHVIEVSVVIAILKVVRSFLSTTAQVLKDQMPIAEPGQTVTRKQTDSLATTETKVEITPKTNEIIPPITP